MKHHSIFKIVVPILLSILSIQLHAQKIGLLLDSYVTDRWYLDQKLISDKVKQLGGQVQIEVAYGDAAEQVKLAKKLIAEGAKTLIVVPVDAHKSIEIVQVAKAAKVPVIAYDRLIVTPDVSFYLSYNSEKVGELQAQYAMKNAPQGNYLLINGPVTDNNAISFRNGQLKALKPSIESGKIKLLGDFVMEDWGEIGALLKTDEFFAVATEKPVAIVAANDALAGGVIQGLPPDLHGKVLITGQDADLAAVKYIVTGAQSMTIYKPIKPLAHLAAETAMKLAKGEVIKDKIQVKSENVTVDAILLDPVVVDKTNYQETVVKDGHVHLQELIDKK